jgi:hypothetical protein
VALLKHRFNSPAPDIGGPNTIKISHWNDSHVFTDGTDGQFLIRDSTQPDGMRWGVSSVYDNGQWLQWRDSSGNLRDILTLDANDNVILSGAVQDLIITAIRDVVIARPVTFQGDISTLTGVNIGDDTTISQWSMRIQPSGNLVLDSETPGAPSIYFTLDGGMWADGSFAYGMDQWLFAWRSDPLIESANLLKFYRSTQALHVGGAYDGAAITGAIVPVLSVLVNVPLTTQDVTVNGSMTVSGDIVNTDLIKHSLVNAKGDLLVGTATDAAGVLPVGANGYTIVADSSEATGIKWVPSPPGPAGPAGPPGADGAPGPGVATGGTAGQVLSKIDATNYNTQWIDPPAGGGGGTVTDVLWTGPSAPVDAATELWYDTDETTGVPGVEEVHVGPNAPTGPEEIWIDSDDVAPSSGGGWPLVPFVPFTTVGWTWVNQGGATVTEGSNVVFFSCPSVPGDQQRLLVKTLPAGTPTITLVSMFNPAFRYNYVAMGPCLRESGSGKFLHFFYQTNTGGGGLGYQRWNSPTSYNAAPLLINTTGGSGFVYQRIRVTATAYVFSLSFDGVNFTDLATENKSAFLTVGANQIGLCVNNQSGYAAGASFLSWVES